MAANPAPNRRPQVGQAVRIRTACPEVLIAEDEPNLRTLLRATLSGAYAVLEAPDGDRAWDLLRAHRPVVAVLDVQMPGRDGLELTRAIKADPALAGTAVVLVTAQDAPDRIAAGRAAGADAYLLKPFLPTELLARIAAVLAAGRPRPPAPPAGRGELRA